MTTLNELIQTHAAAAASAADWPAVAVVINAKTVATSLQILALVQTYSPSENF